MRNVFQVLVYKFFLMSSHSPSHSSHGFGSSIKRFFTSSESYLASTSPDTQRNPLTAVDAIAEEIAIE